MMVLVVMRAQLRSEVLDRVMAVVGGEIITLTDVTAARESRAGGGAADAPDPTRVILTQLIDRELMFAEVDRYAPPEPNEADVDAGFALIGRRFPSDEAFRAALARSGIDENHLRETVRQNLPHSRVPESAIRGALGRSAGARRRARSATDADRRLRLPACGGAPRLSICTSAER